MGCSTAVTIPGMFAIAVANLVELLLLAIAATRESKLDEELTHVDAFRVLIKFGATGSPNKALDVIDLLQRLLDRS
jgi:hypothetical protein